MLTQLWNETVYVFDKTFDMLVSIAKKYPVASIIGCALLLAAIVVIGGR